MKNHRRLDPSCPITDFEKILARLRPERIRREPQPGEVQILAGENLNIGNIFMDRGIEDQGPVLRADLVDDEGSLVRGPDPVAVGIRAAYRRG